MPDQSFRDEIPGGPSSASRFPGVQGTRLQNGRQFGGSAPATDHAALQRVVEAEILPRLLIAHSPAKVQYPQNNPARPLGQIDLSLVEQLADLLLRQDIAGSRAIVVGMLNKGASIEDVLLTLMAPCAHLLGEYWSSDKSDFLAVTLGVAQLQTLMREICHGATTARLAKAADRRSVLLASPAEEQHTFGVFLLEEMFRRAGWHVVTCVTATPDDLAEMAVAQKFSVVGFSVCRSDLIDQVVDGIDAVRTHSRNGDIKVLVGGNCFLQGTLDVRTVGADGAAADGLGAVMVANRMAA